MASPCASAPWSSRYAIASAVTAGWRGMNASTSRCARSLDHDTIAFQVSTSVRQSVMGARPCSGATDSASTPARRCAPREDVPPAVPRRRRLAEDVHVFVILDAFVRRARPGGELLDEREACRARLAQLDDPGVRLACVREGLPFPERDVEEPFAASRVREPHGATLAVDAVSAAAYQTFLGPPQPFLASGNRRGSAVQQHAPQECGAASQCPTCRSLLAIPGDSSWVRMVSISWRARYQLSDTSALSSNTVVVRKPS